MKTTMTGKNSAKRTLAGILAATAMMTALAPSASTYMNTASQFAITASASQELPPDDIPLQAGNKVGSYFDTNKPTLRNQLLMIADGALYDALVPYGGKSLYSYASMVLSFFSETEDGMTTNELHDEIENCQNQFLASMKKTTKQIEKDIVNVTEIQSFYKSFTKLQSMTEVFANDISAINNMNISDDEKALRIANLLGNPDQWTVNSNTFYNTFCKTVTMFKQVGLISKRDIYTALYDYYAKNALFAVEAKRDAQEAVDYIYSNILYSYEIINECFNAHLRVLDMEDTSMLPTAALICFNSNIPDVADCIENTTQRMFGTLEGDAVYDAAGNIFGFENVHTAGADSVTSFYEKFNNIHDLTFIDGKTLSQGGVKLSADMYVNTWTAAAYGWNNQGLNESDITKIIHRANSNGMSFAEYLVSLGFNLTQPQNVPVSKIVMPVDSISVTCNDKKSNATDYEMTRKYFVRTVSPFLSATDAAADKVTESNYRTVTEKYMCGRFAREETKELWGDSYYVVMFCRV